MSKEKNRFYVDIMSSSPEVTGSCNLCVAKFPNGETTKFIVDCGLFQERKYDELNFKLPFDSKNIDFVLITHNHVDHIGRLPLIVKNGFYKEIYTTNVTSKLLPLALYDSCKVLRDVSKRNNIKSLYDDNDVEKTLKLVIGCSFEKTIKITENIKVTFFKNGHLLGASIILVRISAEDCNDINLLFTGDYNNKNMFFDVPNLPKWVLDLPLTIIQESTYGNMDSTEIFPCFKNNILTNIKNQGTSIVLVFSLGRCQEILYEIKCMQDSEELSKEIPVYLDGKLAIRYTQIYLNEDLGIKPKMKNFLPSNLIFVNNECRTELLEDINSKIIITTSGMGSYGPAQSYIPEFISHEDTLIQFTGYTAEGTLGQRLKLTKYGDMVSVGGLISRKLGDVEYTTEYSAHAKSNEMIDFLTNFNNLKLVLINHGEISVKEKFAEKILDEVDSKKVGILGREFFFRVNPYGLVKTMGTKFN